MAERFIVQSMCSILLGLLFSSDLSFSHVALNFPKARMYDLDNLSTKLTKAPCGMPKGWIKTPVPSGMYMNFTWSMSLPHQGGYRIELYDRDYKFLTNLTDLPAGQEYIKGNPTAQYHVVKIPEMQCQDCVVRLVRQGLEFDYDIQSCADVDIIDKRAFRNTCNGRGMPSHNLCYCYKGYSGPLCQYEEECETDFDCSGRGKCIYLGGTNYPSHQCFCAPGFHGDKCAMANLALLPHHQNLDLSKYKHKMMNDKVNLYYMMIPAMVEQMQEIEFIMDFEGISFGALGMRPNSFDESCKNWPVIDEPMMGGSVMEITPNQMRKRDANPENHKKQAPQNNTKGNYVTGVGMQYMMMNQVNQGRIIRPSAYAPMKSTFHPMDCSDITIGAARGIFTRIRDYYTRDLSTPKLDETWGGWDSITSATGWEINGRTTLIFRRRLLAFDEADHSIMGDMHVIWSKGQETGKYVHAAPSGLEAPGEMPTNKMFYTDDEIKYHGGGSQRGSMVINFST